MRNLLVLFLALLVKSVLGQITLNDSLYHQGTFRNYLLHIPPDFTPTESVPLVIVLHGENETAADVMGYTKFNATADAEHFITLYPNAASKYWGNSTIATEAGIKDIDDINFISSLIDSLIAKFNVDADKIYVTGFSNGGFMAQRIACKLSGKIAAVASVSSSIPDSLIKSCTSRCPVPVMFVHGTADAYVPFNGGQIKEANSLKINGDCISSDSAASFWIKKNECSSEPTSLELSDINSGDNSTVTKKAFRSCLDNTEVIQFIINNGGHTWPGASSNSMLGNTNQDINATSEIWKFFNSHILRICITTSSPDKQIKNHSSALSIFPNPVQRSLYISYSDGGINKIEIFDHDGEKVLTFDGNQISYPLNVSGIPAGTYMIKVETTDRETFKNIMIKE